jgi:hypothetical protein
MDSLQGGHKLSQSSMAKQGTRSCGSTLVGFGGLKPSQPPFGTAALENISLGSPPSARHLGPTTEHHIQHSFSEPLPPARG